MTPSLTALTLAEKLFALKMQIQDLTGYSQKQFWTDSQVRRCQFTYGNPMFRYKAVGCNRLWRIDFSSLEKGNVVQVYAVRAKWYIVSKTKDRCGGGQRVSNNEVDG